MKYAIMNTDFLTSCNRCSSGCEQPGNASVVAITDRKVFEYICSENCETVFGGLSQSWSLFMYDSSGVLQPDDVITSSGLLMSRELMKLVNATICVFYVIRLVTSVLTYCAHQCSLNAATSL